MNKSLTAASGYIESLLWLLDNELERSTSPDIYKFEDDPHVAVCGTRFSTLRGREVTS